MQKTVANLECYTDPTYTCNTLLASRFLASPREVELPLLKLLLSLIPSNTAQTPRRPAYSRTHITTIWKTTTTHKAWTRNKGLAANLSKVKLSKISLSKVTVAHLLLLSLALDGEELVLGGLVQALHVA